MNGGARHVLICNTRVIYQNKDSDFERYDGNERKGYKMNKENIKKLVNALKKIVRVSNLKNFTKKIHFLFFRPIQLKILVYIKCNFILPLNVSIIINLCKIIIICIDRIFYEDKFKEIIFYNDIYL